MRALRVETENGPEGLVVADIPDPPESGLVVRVRAAGVGFPDLLMSRGEFQIRQPLPFTLGWEAAGEVVHAPEGSRFAEGDRVVTLSFGAHAEKVTAIPEATFPLPASFTFEQGAAYPLNYLTAYAALRRRAAVREGESVLVHGAGGGIGTASIQVAKALGARVFAVASSDEKAEAAARAGAEEVYRTDDDWRAGVTGATGGVDIVIDPVGGDRFKESLRSLAPEGRLIVVGFAAGEIPTLAVNRLLLNNTDVRGCSWSVLANRPDGLAEAAAHLNEMAERGELTPPVVDALPLEKAPEALLAMAERRSVARTVLTPGPPRVNAGSGPSSPS